MSEYELKYTADRTCVSVFAPTEVECWVRLGELLSKEAKSKKARIEIYHWPDEVNKNLKHTTRGTVESLA